MENFSNLKKKIDQLKKMGWIECDHQNYGGAGIKIEKLLDIHSDNFEIPDYNGIEIKTKKSSFRTKISLFNSAPDSNLFEIKKLYELYSYPDPKNKNYRILNKSITSTSLSYIYSNLYFTLKIDKNNKLIKLIVCDSSLNVIDDSVSWSFSLLQEKLERKLKYLCYIQLNNSFIHNQLYIRIKNVRYFVLKDFTHFINLLENGKISITFKIGIFKNGKRKGQMHDHGTSFSIDEKDLNYLFTDII